MEKSTKMVYEIRYDQDSRIVSEIDNIEDARLIAKRIAMDYADVHVIPIKE